MWLRRLTKDGKKTKDVKPQENTSRVQVKKKSVNSLPKILMLAYRGGSLQSQRVRCGKLNCRCALGQLHEGYYYLFVSHPTGVHKWYVRRSDIPRVRQVIEERRSREQAWRSELRDAQGFLRQLLKSAGVNL